MKHTDHHEVLKCLNEAQEVERDIRARAREAINFVSAPNGQWEEKWWNLNDKKPRYTFDMTSPIVKQITGPIKRMSFGVDVSPAGGDADDDTAKIYSGLVRRIQSTSQAKHVYNRAAKKMVQCGIDGWRVVQKYVEDDSFDQDLAVEHIPNFLDRVWFDPGAEEQDKSDASRAYILSAIGKKEAEEKYPDITLQSVDVDRSYSTYYHQPDVTIIGEYFYKKEEQREIALMSNGQVFEVNDDYKMVRDELMQLGITEVKRRKRTKSVVYRRLFHGGGWLDEPKETVFQWIPIIPCIANFDIVENKTIYHGVVEKNMDAQRVFNYSKSREVEEGALAPRGKYWMTKTQAAGHEKKLATLNTNSDPVQFFNADAENPGAPMYTGGPQINPGLHQLSEDMRQVMLSTSGQFAATQGDNPGLQSGVAIERLQDRGDNHNEDYIEALEIAIGHTARILVDAIPRVYSGRQQVEVLEEDGTRDSVTLSEKVFDQQSGQWITMNDLSKGIYDVVCSAGPSFQSRQKEMVAAMSEVATVDPSIMETGSDLFLKSIPAPGMDQLAERKREQLLNAGMIPISQMTDEEKQRAIQAAQESQGQQDPNAMIGQAEMLKAQADMQRAQLDVEKAQLEREKVQLDREKAQLQILKEQRELRIKEYDAETKRLTQETKEFEVGANVTRSDIETLYNITQPRGQPNERPGNSNQ